jgi:hypothetical protein
MTGNNLIVMGLVMVRAILRETFLKAVHIGVFKTVLNVGAYGS